MISALSAVFIASLLGSGHCAGMCGAFVAIAVAASPGGSERGSSSRAGLLAGYNAGRLLTYTILGALAGAVGAVVDLGGRAVGLQRAALVLAGAFILAFGLVALLRQLNVRIARAPLPSVLQRLVVRVHRIADRFPPVARAVTIGAVTTLLPCGWLWAFVITASGSAHPLAGAVVMDVFWLGTLPVMVGLGAGVQMVAGRLGSRLPVLTSILLIAVGVMTVAGRMAVPAVAMPTTVHQGPASIAPPSAKSASSCPLCHPGSHAGERVRGQ